MNSRMRPVSRLRVKLARMLETALSEWWKANQSTPFRLTVKPEALYPARGWYRTSGSIFNDAARWDGYAHDPETGNTMATFQSFDRMTDCVARGFTLSHDRVLGFDVHANEHKVRLIERGDKS